MEPIERLEIIQWSILQEIVETELGYWSATKGFLRRKFFRRRSGELFFKVELPEDSIWRLFKKSLDFKDVNLSTCVLLTRIYSHKSISTASAGKRLLCSQCLVH